MDYRIEFSPTALMDIEEAHEWIALRSEAQAARWHESLLNEIESLKHFPRRCPIALEGDALGGEVRELLYGNRRNKYRILFSIEGDLIAILTVRHAARGPLLP